MIEFRNVQKIYKEDQKIALKNASFKVNAGDFVFFSGPSGAGKSTVLKMIYKEELPTKGDIYLFDKPIKKIKEQVLRRKIGIVFQSFNLLPTKTAYENITYVLECLGHNPFTNRKKTLDILERFGLSHLRHKYPKQMSGGEQQRVALARAVINKPKIILCDEPTNNLDEENAKIVMDYLKKLNDEGITVLMATHDQNIISEMNKKVAHVKDGKITIDDPDIFDLSRYGG